VVDLLNVSTDRRPENICVRYTTDSYDTGIIVSSVIDGPLNWLVTVSEESNAADYGEGNDDAITEN